MKKLLLAIVLIAIVGGVVPFYAGIRAESELNKLVELINANPGYTAHWAHYTKGWFTTSAQLQVLMANYDSQTGQQGSIDVPFGLEVMHGPLLTNPKFQLGWFSFSLFLREKESAYLSQRVSSAGAGDLFHSSGHMDLAGQLYFRNEIMPFTANDTGLAMAFAGYSGSGVVAPAGKLVYGGQSGEASVEMDDEDGHVKLVLGEARLQVVSDYSRLVPGTSILPSKAEFVLPKVTLSINGDRSVVNDIRILAEATLPEDMNVVNFGVNAQVADGDIVGQTFTDFSLVLAYNRISLPLVERYIAMTETLLTNTDKQADPSQFFTSDIVNEALSYKPEIALNQFSVTLDEGSVQSHVIFQLEPVDGIDPTLLSLNPLALLNMLTVNLHVQIDKPLAKKLAIQHATDSVESQLETEREAGVEGKHTAEQKQELIDDEANMLLQALVNQGVIVEAGERYQTTIGYDKGDTLINGNPSPIPLGALLQMGF